MKKNLIICIFAMLAAVGFTSCTSDEPSYPSVLADEDLYAVIPSSDEQPGDYTVDDVVLKLSQIEAYDPESRKLKVKFIKTKTEMDSFFYPSQTIYFYSRGELLFSAKTYNLSSSMLVAGLQLWWLVYKSGYSCIQFEQVRVQQQDGTYDGELTDQQRQGFARMEQILQKAGKYTSDINWDIPNKEGTDVDSPTLSEESLGKLDENGNFVIANSNPPSNDALLDILSGYGWHEASTHEITSTGQYLLHEYWEDMDGGAPRSYEFEREAVTSYMYLDWAPADAYYHQQMRYDETTGKVYFDNDEAFTVLSATADEVRIVKFAGVRGGDNTRIYHYIILNKLTPDELQYYKDHYTTDYATLSPWSVTSPPQGDYSPCTSHPLPHRQLGIRRSAVLLLLTS